MNSSLPNFRLDGRVALVTGASSGLGRHFAALLAAAGAVVVAAARRVDRLDETVSAIGAAGHDALAVALDVTDAASVRQCFDDIQQRLGRPVDVLVNNAGVAPSGSVLEMPEADWDATIDTNLKGAWLVAQEAARRMVAAAAPGAIVNIASITGERVAASVAPYCASKAALIHLTKSMALELARHRIRVNALAPGYVRTELNDGFLDSAAGEKLQARIPQRRFGSASDLDGPLLLLASDAGGYMTGSVVCADGGHLVSSL